jgi:hypothetical protein
MIMTKDKDHVIFKNNPSIGYWEIVGPVFTTYLMYEVIGEDQLGAMALMLMLHNIPNIGEICMTILEYMKNPQEDMFLVEI